MSRNFLIYCAGVLLAFSGASYYGYAVSNLFGDSRHHGPQGHGNGMGGGGFYGMYHK